MRARLLEYFGEVPRALEAHFKRIADKPQLEDATGLNLLSVDQAITLTRALSGFRAELQAIDGLILDDMRNGSFHVYVGHLFFTGAILYLTPDADTRIVFSSLDEYWKAIGAASSEKRAIADFHPPSSPLAPYQKALTRVIRRQLQAPHGANVIRALLPSSDLSDYVLLRQLVSDGDFLLGEVVANEIRKRPARGLREIAERCMAHSHLRVVMAGLNAYEAIAELPE